MRIIRLKIDPAVRLKLKAVASEVKSQPDFVEDVYAIMRLKGNGLPSNKRMDGLTDQLAKSLKSKLSARIAIRKRAHVLKNLIGLTYFTSLSRLSNPVYAVEKLLRQLNQIGARVRQSQCATCALAATCDFGKQYSGQVYDITKVIDSDYSKKVHADCPNLPEMDQTNKFNQAILMFAQLFSPANKAQNQALASQMDKDPGDKGLDDEAFNKLDELAAQNDPERAEEDDADPEEERNGERDEEDFSPNTLGGRNKCSLYDSTFSAEYYVQIQDKLIESLLKVGLDLFEIAQKLDDLLSKSATTNFKPTEELSTHQDTTQIKSLSDIAKVDKSEHALPEELYDAKLAKKSLKMQQQKAPTKKRQLLYVLIDVSGSMRTHFSKTTQNVISRASFATVLVTSLTKKVRDDNGIMFLRFFAGQPSPLSSMRTKDEFDAFIAKLRTANYDGGGTNIKGAISAAVQDIADSQDEISKAEILLVTDADDSLTMDKSALRGVPLSVLDVSGERNALYTAYYSSRGDDAPSVLKRIASKYYKANEKTMNLKDIVELV